MNDLPRLAVFESFEVRRLEVYTVQAPRVGDRGIDLNQIHADPNHGIGRLLRGR
jgi:hypothetical protein